VMSLKKGYKDTGRHSYCTTFLRRCCWVFSTLCGPGFNPHIKDQKR